MLPKPRTSSFVSLSISEVRASYFLEPGFLRWNPCSLYTQTCASPSPCLRHSELSCVIVKMERGLHRGCGEDELRSRRKCLAWALVLGKLDPCELGALRKGMVP